MSDQPRSKRMVFCWRLATVALIALVLALGASSLRGEPKSAAAPVATGQTAASGGAPEAPGAPGVAAGPKEPPTPKELAPMPRCWREVQRLDRDLTLDNFRAVLASVGPSEDRYLLTYLQERLTRFVGNNPQTALKVLSWAEEVGEGLDLVVFMEALKKAPAVHSPTVSERLLQMAENPKGSTALRAASVIGLETQKRFEPAALKRLKAIALDEKADQVAWNATRTIGWVMEEDFKNTGNYKPYWDQLLDISRQSEDRAVRGLALEMPTYANLILDGDSIEGLGEIMRTDRDREMRELAAMRLSVTEAPEKALEAYRKAFTTENDFCVRWAIFRYALRAAGAAALPVVQQFAQQEPRLQQDYLDFKELYAQGTLDWERIWLEKKLYDYHHACADAHDPETRE